MSTAPCPFSLQQRKNRFPETVRPGQRTSLPFSCIFSSRAAIARNGLMVEPGGVRPLQALVLHRLARVGVQRLPVGLPDPARERVRVERGAGEDRQDLPRPRERAITAPARLPSASWAVTWRSASSSVDGAAGPRRQPPRRAAGLSPAASTSTFRPPFTPRSSVVHQPLQAVLCDKVPIVSESSSD